MRSDAVEFLVLGPLEARAGRERILLGGPRQRALLADLVLHAGLVVSRDTLIDDLWAGEPPPTAEAVVQNAVHRLRVLVGKEAIETRPPGYALRAEPGAIDARRFERLVHDARPLPPAERSAALRDALALWRGSPFADLSYESFLQAEIARLDELRLTVLEDRIGAEIELGRHDEVIPDAAPLAAQHPDRERLCRLLMLALARAGRQQEALDAYETTRRALDERWALEPSPEMRSLQRMIYTQDPALAAFQREPAGAAAASRRPLALLLVEILLDDGLELEAAGSALEDARRTLGEVVKRHGGVLTPQSGVELIAAFGTESASEDDVLRAARSAVELHEMLSGRHIEARLAVGTGRLLVEDGQPILVGAVLDRTRRALHETDRDRIVVTPLAARLGGDAFELDADGRLLGVHSRRPRLTATSPLVGRLAELAALRAAFNRVVRTGRPQHAVVVGEAGIGKSRLVTAFVQDVSATVFETACVAYGEGSSFLPLRDLAEQAAALDDSAPEVGELTTADEALAAARSLFEHFAASDPLVVVLDDLHWAVPTFLDLIEYVVRAVDGPLLVISATRPELLERRPAWGPAATVLESLPREDARRLVEALPERAALDETVANAVLEAAEGVPLFLEQLVAHAAESEPADDHIPVTLDALLASRIDLLQPGERAVLLRAAVVGRAFSKESIDALTPEPGLRELDGRLASLTRRRLLRARAGEHEFVHPLVRRASYLAIARAERAAMHERFARWLDQRDGSDELVGTHLERAALASDAGIARDPLAREASERLGRSGLRALHWEDYAAARNLLERAVALLETNDPARLELECGLAEVLGELGRLQSAVTLLESIIERARALSDRRLEFRARVELVWPRLLDGSLAPRSAARLLDQALAHFDEVGDTLGVARAEFAYSTLLMEFGNRSDQATPHLIRAVVAYRRLGQIGSTDLALVHAGTKGSTPVEELIAACYDRMAAQPDRPTVQAHIGHWLAFLLGLRGDLDDARAMATVARQQLAELGHELALRIVAAKSFGSIEAFAGNWEAAESNFAPALEYVAQWESTSVPPWRGWRAYFLLRMGEIALARGDPEHALRLAHEARERSRVVDSLTSVWLLRIEARALAGTGHPRNAARLAWQAVERTDASDDLLEQGETRLDLAEVLLHGGATRQATTAVHQGLELLDRKGAALLTTNGRARYAELLPD